MQVKYFEYLFIRHLIQLIAWCQLRILSCWKEKNTYKHRIVKLGSPRKILFVDWFCTQIVFWLCALNNKNVLLIFWTRHFELKKPVTSNCGLHFLRHTIVFLVTPLPSTSTFRKISDVIGGTRSAYSSGDHQITFDILARFLLHSH